MGSRQTKYNASEKGKASRAAWRASEKGKAWKAKWNASDSAKAWKAKWNASEKGKAFLRRSHLKKAYKLTLEDWQRMAESQGNACAICREPLDMGKKTHVDHDHSCCPGEISCGKCVRGLLCSRCNLLLGWLESPHVGKALDYLKVP